MSRTPHRLQARLEQAAGLAGLLFAILMTAALFLFNTLAAPTESTSLLIWLDEVFAPRLRLVGLYIVPLAGIAFLWFMAAIRERSSVRTDRFFDTVFLGSGLLFIAMLFGGAASAVSIVTAQHFGPEFTPTEESVRMARLLGYSFFNIYAARAAGVFTMTTSGMLLRSGLFPRWVGLIGLVVAAILLLGGAFFRLTIYLFPAWVALTSIVFLIVQRNPSTSEEPPGT